MCVSHTRLQMQSLVYAHTYIVIFLIYEKIKLLLFRGVYIHLCSTSQSQKTTCRNQFSPSTLWVLGIKLKLVASTVTHWILPWLMYSHRVLYLFTFVCGGVCVLLCGSMCVWEYAQGHVGGSTYYAACFELREELAWVGSLFTWWVWGSVLSGCQTRW